jgi:holliday junction resolvase YEN1
MQAASFSTQKRAEFFNQWRKDLCHEIHKDSSGFIGRRNPKLAASVPDNFPDPQVLLAYVKPVTSASDDSFQIPSSFGQQRPDVGKMAVLCHRWFSWGDAEGIVTKLSKILWPGICFQSVWKV